MRSILFISHDASRSGAPYVLLNFLRWIKQNKFNVKVTVLALHGGELSKNFEEISDVYLELDTVLQPIPTFFQDGKRRLLKKIGRSPRNVSPQEKYLEEVAIQGFDAIYANTVVSLPVATQIKEAACSAKLFLHVHELKQIIETRIPEISKYLEKVDSYIAVSNIVKNNLIYQYKVPDKKIEVIYPFSSIQKVEVEHNHKKDFIVGGSGTQLWGKGGDLFLQVAFLIKSSLPEANIKFIWVGHLSRQEELLIESDIEKAGLADVVEFIGEEKNPSRIFSSFDVFLMTSREDSFPLVCIEVGMLGKPILCFRGATGTEEVLINGGGKIAPYLDTRTMAENVIKYYLNRDELKVDGEKAKKIFSEFNAEKICPKLFQLISRSL